MRVLLVSATQMEIVPFLKKRTFRQERNNFFSSRSGKNVLDVLITGAGMTATAFHLGKIFSEKKYQLAVNAGICGSFRKKFPPGTVVNVTSDCFADFGAEDGKKFLTAEETGLTLNIKYTACNLKLKNKILNALPETNGITVNKVHGNPSSIKKIIKRFEPDIESMEGAAFFYACRQEKIPYIQVRAVSNFVGRRDRKNWEINLAVENICLFLEKIFL